MEADQMPPKSVVPRACQNCRLRKEIELEAEAPQTRCDRRTPCSNCLTSGISCQPSSQSVARLVVPGARVGPSASEGKNDRLDELYRRLTRVEEAIKNHFSQQTTTPFPTRRASSRVDNQGMNINERREFVASYEGDSSFRRQTLSASRIAELTSSETAWSPGVMNELANLQNMLGACQRSSQTQSTYDLRPSYREGDPYMELLPSDFVLRLLRKVIDSQSLLFLFFPVQNRAQVDELCRRVYFPVNPPSIGELTLLNGMLGIILEDLNCIQSSALEEGAFKTFGSICKRNFQAGLETYEVMAIATYEHALALSLAITQAQMEGDLARQWNLTSIAARHCLTLGYHREETIENASPYQSERIRRLFWQIYISDHDLALSLGRAPVIQDYDVDVELQPISSDPGRSPWDTTLVAFVQFSKIQAQIYESLYSPAATKRNVVERQATVDDISARLSQWHQAWRDVDGSSAYRCEVFRSTFAPFDVIYYSVLTLVHRGVDTLNSAGTISSPCLEAAQQALQTHLEISAQIAHGTASPFALYSIWILLYSSFTPYIVMFLHCIKNTDFETLALLKNVIHSFERMESTTEQCKRQLELCRAMNRIAEAFIEARRTTCEEGTLNGGLSMPLTHAFGNSWGWLDSNLQHDILLSNPNGNQESYCAES